MVDSFEFSSQIVEEEDFFFDDDDIEQDGLDPEENGSETALDVEHHPEADDKNSSFKSLLAGPSTNKVWPSISR